MIKTLSFSSSAKQQLIDITPEVKNAVKESGAKEGVCYLFVVHSTAALTINENADPNITEDIINALDEIIPSHGKWKHDVIDNNAAAHIKASMLGSSETIPIKDNNLVLGTWQDIFLCEFDGPRDGRKVIVKIIKDN